MKDENVFNLEGELSMQVHDKDGNVKPIFQENRLLRYMLENNFVTPHFPKIPFLLGKWTTKKVIKI